MIHENIDISGSLNISGSFIVANGPSGSTPSNPDTGSLFFNTTDSTLYEWIGSWSIVGTQVQPPPSADIEYLVVAGGAGGGGGGWGAGGGGAGGMLSSSLSSIESGSSITVTVGAGGTGRGGGNTFTAGGDGGTSSISSTSGTSFTTVSTVGGGGGGAESANSGLGRDGGSGGGSTQQNASGGSGTAGQGNDGGTGGTITSPGYPGAGGGGKGSVGSNASGNNGGDGGTGQASSITGTSLFYAAGGGGGTRTSGAQGSGGSSIGGDGANDATAATSATINRGAGGGGAAGNSNANASNGSSGVVILAYDSGSINGAGGIVGDAGNGRKYHQFNTTGIFKAGSTSDFGIVTDSLVSHYDAGNFASRGTSTWTDLQGNNNGTVTTATLGNNFYYDFTGNAYVSTGINHSSYSTLSYDIWAYIDSSTVGNIVGGANQSNRHRGMFSAKPTQIDYISIGQDFMRTTAVSLSDGWHHFVITDAGSTDGAADVTLYIDGSSVSIPLIVDNYGSTETRTNNNLQLGRGTKNTGAFDYGFEDKIAQFRFYSDVLTASEVLQNYNATKTNFV